MRSKGPRELNFSTNFSTTTLLCILVASLFASQTEANALPEAAVDPLPEVVDPQAVDPPLAAVESPAADPPPSEPDRLVFVQAAWRHGDRSPTTTWKNDPNQEEQWPQGWGQLTPEGMRQHVVLGKKLRQKYIKEQKLVSERYKNHEIYVKSTDVNRTLVSAISNLIGFYGETAQPGVDFPDKDWPTGYIPIAVHTADNYRDNVGNTDGYCPRRKKIVELWPETPEYKDLLKEKQWVFDKLTNLTGQEINPGNIGIVADALFIEDVWKSKLNLSYPDWATPDFVKEINSINWKLETWTAGKMKPYNGVDFSTELPKLRGGGMLWSIITLMQEKIECLKQASEAKPDGQMSRMCKWNNPLKYYVYSVHDTTLSALFSTFGFNKTNYDVDGYPHYSACVTIELWQRADKTNYVKVLYWIPGDKLVIEDMTKDIVGCEKGCSLDEFTKRSLPYKAEPNPAQYCENTDLSSSAPSALSSSSLASMTQFFAFALLSILFGLHLNH